MDNFTGKRIHYYLNTKINTLINKTVILIWPKLARLYLSIIFMKVKVDPGLIYKTSSRF